MSVSTNGYSIDLRRDGKHKLNSLDADGDGVADGQSLTGESGRMTNVTGTGQAVVNQMLRANTNNAVSHTLSQRGLELTERGITSRDGFNIGDPNGRAALDFTGAPTLPDNTTMTHLGTAPVMTHTGTV